MNCNHVDCPASRLSKLEEKLSEALSRINAQDVEIRNLKERLHEEKIGRASLDKLVASKCNSLFDNNSWGSRILKDAEVTVNIEGNNMALNVADLLAMHTKDITSMKGRLRKCLTKEQVQQCCDASKVSIISKMEASQDSANIRHKIEKQDGTLRQFHKQVVALQQLVACKIDRSEANLLEEARNQLEDWSGFRKTLDVQLKRMQELQQHGQQEIKGNKENIRKCFDANRAIEIFAHNLPSREEVAKLHEFLREMIEKVMKETMIADRERSDELIKIQKCNETKLSALQKKLETHKCKQVKNINKLNEELKTRYKTEEAKKFIDGTIFSSLSSTKDDIAQSISSLSKQVNHNRSQILQKTKLLEDEQRKDRNKANSMTKQIEVMVRFVDWFSKRGKSYEHNANILERHLESLAHISNPHAQDQYLPPNDIDYIEFT